MITPEALSHIRLVTGDNIEHNRRRTRLRSFDFDAFSGRRQKCNMVVEEETALGYLLFKSSCCSHYDDGRLDNLYFAVVLCFRRMFPEETIKYSRRALP